MFAASQLTGSCVHHPNLLFIENVAYYNCVIFFFPSPVSHSEVLLTFFSTLCGGLGFMPICPELAVNCCKCRLLGSRSTVRSRTQRTGPLVKRLLKSACQTARRIYMSRLIAVPSVTSGAVVKTPLQSQSISFTLGRIFQRIETTGVVFCWSDSRAAPPHSTPACPIGK